MTSAGPESAASGGLVGVVAPNGDIEAGSSEYPYQLDVLEPGTLEDVALAFRSSAPFMRIGVGDVMDMRGFVPTRAGTPWSVFRVTKVEHRIWEASGRIKHRVVLHTTGVNP